MPIRRGQFLVLAAGGRERLVKALSDERGGELLVTRGKGDVATAPVRDLQPAETWLLSGGAGAYATQEGSATADKGSAHTFPCRGDAEGFRAWYGALAHFVPKRWEEC
jgi:hypothetical protein